MGYSAKLNLIGIFDSITAMPEDDSVKITVSMSTKQLIDELKGSLSYNDFLEPIVEKDTEYSN